MERTMSARKVRAFRILAQANDLAHSMVMAFLLFGHLLVGVGWHALFIVLVVRLQLAYKGCPMTLLSDFLRSFSEDGKQVRIFRRGATATIYQKYGPRALPLIAGGWFLNIYIQRLVLDFWR